MGRAMQRAQVFVGATWREVDGGSVIPEQHVASTLAVNVDVVGADAMGEELLQHPARWCSPHPASR